MIKISERIIMYKLSILAAVILSMSITACSSLSEQDLIKLQSSNQIVKNETIVRIAKGGFFTSDFEKKAVPILVKMLSGGKESENTQINILKALGDLGMNRRIPSAPLIEKLKDDSQLLRFQAVESLGKMKNKEAVPALLDLLAEEPDKYHIIWALGEIGDKRAIPALNQLLNSEDKAVQYNAGKALKKIQ